MTEPAAGLRIVFAGTPRFAAEHLAALLGSRHDVVAVYTQPDRPAGRGKRLQPGPVKALATEKGLTVLQPASLKSEEARQELARFEPDVMVVVAYGLILPQAVLDIPRFGCINVHGSLLPRWRGAAPVQRAVEAGDRETGVTIMQMDAGLDTGPMLAKARCEIAETDTAADVFDKLTELGPPALLNVLDELETGSLQAEKQNDAQATYAEKIQKAEVQIDWRESATTIARKVRAFNPMPVAFTTFKHERLKVYRAHALEQSHEVEAGTIIEADEAGIVVACGDGALSIEQLQLPGKKALPVAEVLRGQRDKFQPGDRFDLPPFDNNA